MTKRLASVNYDLREFRPNVDRKTDDMLSFSPLTPSIATRVGPTTLKHPVPVG